MGIITKGNGRVVFGSSNSVITDGLEFYVDAANPMSYVSGNTTTDSLVGDKIGTLINGTGFSTINQGAWDFDGIDDRFTLRPLITASHLTYSVWFRPAITDGDFRTLGQTGNWSTTEFACFFKKVPAGGLNLRLRTKSGDADTSTSQPAVINPNFYNTWHNATFVIEPSTQYIYYNGQFMTSTARTNNTDITINSLSLGLSMGYGYYSGKIASNILYSRKLSPTEILQNYNALKGRFGL